MPEYLAPGVYVEEVPSSPKPIQGVDTSSTGFVGAAASGPPDTAIGPLGSLAEFEAQFGDGKMLVCAGKPPAPAFLWHATRAFFDEGGTDLYVVRVSRAGTADGQPQASDFERGLSELDDVPYVAMIAAPGSTFDETGDSYDEAMTITSALIAHAERMRDRMAVIDTPNGQSVDQARKWRSNFASSFASLHFPWVKVSGPDGSNDLLLPPSSFVAGVYARSDKERGVQKSPADVALRSAIGLELAINDAQQQLLNPDGINCIREFPGPSYRLWGARTLSADPEWKYVNVRRYFLYLEASLFQGLQWAVFEPDGEALWQNVRRTVFNFLFNEWRGGAIVGTKPEEAFFVRCDRSTMTQNDVDNGRVIVLVGAAPLQPAEFVIFRIAVQTAST